jgi:hypothetical protein
MAVAWTSLRCPLVSVVVVSQLVTHRVTAQWRGPRTGRRPELPQQPPPRTSDIASAAPL